MRYLTMLITLLPLNISVMAIDWPVAPFKQSHQIGNSYGEYQNYGSASYMHPGIDILVPPGTPVYAVKSGYVKAILTISADLHWRVAIGDSAGAAPCDGWLYAHLDKNTIAVYEGQYVEKGTYLGNIVHWPVGDFHHVHFVKIHNSGEIWNSDWQFIGNPLDELDSITDYLPPVFDTAYAGQIFAFCQNESQSYFGPGEILSGDVDIICRVSDYINGISWPVAPYRIEYRIIGEKSTPWINAVTFTGTLDYDKNINVVYQDDRVLECLGDYDDRVYYFNVTNSDGDSVIEATDRNRSWQTADFHNGPYTVAVRAYDRAGNVTEKSLDVGVLNYYRLAGAVSFADGNPDRSQTEISIYPSGIVASTDSEGTFSIPMVGGGAQEVTIAMSGYEPFDTTVIMNRHQILDIELMPRAFLVGDANSDDRTNVGDAVYLMNYIYRSGFAPRPYMSGDADSDGQVTTGDVVFLINHIYKGGPGPGDGPLAH